MTQRIDLIGKRFGRLVVVKATESRHGRLHWACACDCGRQVVVSGSNLKSHTRSCGCLAAEVQAAQAMRRNLRHGHNRAGEETPTHGTWAGMLKRCRNPRHKDYPSYGGRGITVCDRWLQFENFLADMGERPDGLTLDRKDVNGNYEPNNCRWATPSEQQRNKRCHAA